MAAIMYDLFDSEPDRSRRMIFAKRASIFRRLPNPFELQRLQAPLSSQPKHDPSVGLRLGKRFAQRHAIVLWRSVFKTRRGGLSSSLHIRRR